MRIALPAAALSALMLSACATAPSQSPGVLGGAAAGAATGAVLGAVIGNNRGTGDAGDGAKTGAIAGAIAGGIYGLSRDNAIANQQSQAQYGQQPQAAPQRYYDERARRYYTFDPRTGRTYWEDGSLRS